MLAGFEDIPEHTLSDSGNTASALRKKEKDICITYQDTKPSVWAALKKSLQDEYSLSVSIQMDCLCLQLTPKMGKEDIPEIAHALAETIAGVVQRLTMERMIRHVRMGECSESVDILVMLAMARAAQKGYSLSDETYVGNIQRRIYDCIKTHRTFNLEGFLTFRMRDYLNGWAVCVDDVLQYVTAKAEYNAYMDILKQFYKTQPCRCQNAVVFENSGGGYVIRADGRDVRIFWRAPLRMQTAEEELMHILLQLAPAHIEVRLIPEAHKMAVIQTLQLVFGSVVEIKQDD